MAGSACPSVTAGRPRGGREAGAFTLSYVILVPVFLAGLMVVAQAAAWYLARETALAAARTGANAARAFHAVPGAGPRVALAFARSAAPAFLLRPAASTSGSTPTTVEITVTGRVPSLVPGLVIGVREVVRAPVERFVASGRPPGVLRLPGTPGPVTARGPAASPGPATAPDPGRVAIRRPG